MDSMNLKISASPHVRSKDTTSDIMFDVILALVPATVFGLYQYGWYSVLLVAVCMITCVLAEFLYEKGMRRKITVGDCSAALTGLLLALNLPPKLPIWMAMVGCVFAIVVVKQLFGGLGQNFMNPALAARCFLLLAFSKYMTAFVYDGISTATPLAVLKNGGSVDIMDMFVGKTAGTIGEASTIALLVGAGYLLIRKIISPYIPLTYIGTFAICIAIYAATKDKDVVDFTLAHLCGGGLMLGAWFMATDYVTSPITPKGKVVYGVMLGLLTFVLRIFGASAEGVSYAIIISNLFVPLIEKATVPKAFGEGADKKDEKKHEEKKIEESAEINKADEETESKTKSFDTKAIFKAIAALFIITIVMGALLGVVYNVTKKPIDKANEKAKQEAYLAVFPEADTIKIMTEEEDNLPYDRLNEVLHSKGYESNNVDEVAAAVKDEKVIGLAFVVTNKDGYGGNITMVVGIDTKYLIKGVSFLSINETAGLGMEATKAEFINQFKGKQMSIFSYSKTGATGSSEIDAISGATITTSAVVDGVNAACQAFFIMLGGN